MRVNQIILSHLGFRIFQLLESANINPKNIDINFTPNIPAWCMNKPKIILKFTFKQKVLNKSYYHEI